MVNPGILRYIIYCLDLELKLLEDRLERDISESGMEQFMEYKLHKSMQEYQE